MFTKNEINRLKKFYANHTTLCNKLTDSTDIEVFFEFVKLCRRKNLLSVQGRFNFLNNKNRVAKIRSINIYLKNIMVTKQREKDALRYQKSLNSVVAEDDITALSDFLWYNIILKKQI